MNLTTIVQIQDTKNFTDIGVILLKLANVTQSSYGLSLDRTSDRRLSLFGVVAGFLLLLSFLTFIACIRQRKIYQDWIQHQQLRGEPLRYYRVYCRLNHNAQDVSNHSVDNLPPAYETVIADDSENLPDYYEALAQDEMQSPSIIL